MIILTHLCGFHLHTHKLWHFLRVIFSLTPRFLSLFINSCFRSHNNCHVPLPVKSPSLLFINERHVNVRHPGLSTWRSCNVYLGTHLRDALLCKFGRYLLPLYIYSLCPSQNNQLGHSKSTIIHYSMSESSVKKQDVAVDVESLKSDPSLNKVFHNESNLSRGLKLRHIQMLTLVGVFGTGLFLSSGTTLYLTGNVGMLISYIFIGILVGLNQLANIEISCFMPVTGAYIRHAEHFVDKAFSFSLGWISVYQHILPSEISAAALVVGYWSDLNPAVWISIFIVVIVAMNSYNIRFYGEIEFAFGLLKVLLIAGLIILSAVIDLGGAPKIDRIGFRYWKESPFKPYYAAGSLGKFLAWWKAASSVVYSFGGINNISLYGGETQNPRHSIYVAGKRVFYRTFSLYLLTVLGLTLILSSMDSAIASPTGDSAGSPFVIAVKRANIKVLPSIINAVVLSSAFSAANLSLVTTSRSLFALAAKGQAPKIFLKTNRNGMPYYGMAFTALLMPLSYMSCSSGASTVFGWFQNLTSANLLVGWMAIAFNHIAMQRALKAQGFSRDDLPYKMPFADKSAYISLFFFALLLLTGGFSTFLKGNWDTSSFFSSYFVIPLFFVLYLFWKFFKKTQYITPEQCDLNSLFRNINEEPESVEHTGKGWGTIKLLWS